MNSKKFRFYLIYVCIVSSLSGCSTTEVSPSLPPNPPVYTQVPHPVGMDLSDISAIFNNEKAPQDKSFSKTCDAGFRKLEAATQSRDEVLEGLRELIKQDPVAYHWCFYAKILALENDLKAESYVDERQKAVLDAFSFLAPAAHIYASEFHDSRYMRMAISRYQKWSEWIFYRKLELTPAGTSELVKASNPFGLWRDTLETVSVLEKYNIAKAMEAEKTTSKEAEKDTKKTGETIGVSKDAPTAPVSGLSLAPPVGTPSPSPTPTPTAAPSPTATPAPVPVTTPVTAAPSSSSEPVAQPPAGGLATPTAPVAPTAPVEEPKTGAPEGASAASDLPIEGSPGTP